MTHWQAKARDKHVNYMSKPGGLKRDQLQQDILALAYTFGDEQPDDIAGSDKIEIDLDPGLTKGNLYYADYLDKCDTEHTPPAKYSWFIAVWNATFGPKGDVTVCYNHGGDNPQLLPRKYVIVLKDEAKKKKFHDCKFCAGKKAALAQCKPEEGAKKKQIRAERMHHFVHEVKVEKRLYYGRRAEGKETMRQAHGGAVSIIMDGEDKSSHQCPHAPRVAEDVEKLERLKLKVLPPVPVVCCSLLLALLRSKGCWSMD